LHHAPDDPPVRWRIVTPDRYPPAAALRAASTDAGSADGMMFCLPPEPDANDAALLLQSAQEALASPACKRFLLLQHGGGGGFARTLALEAPYLAVALIDLPLELPNAVTVALAEGGAASRVFTEARYDKQGGRFVPALQAIDPAPPVSAPFDLRAGDVVLVTGSGKGIGAECALALSAGNDVTLVLLGRSPEDDPPLAANLARMRAAGRRVHYFRADVGVRAEVEAALKRIAGMVGPVTVLLHAAGSNRPARIATLDAAALDDALRAKWHGARNLLDMLDPQHLRLLVGFGSIIARMGLEGEAHYALANEWLARLIDDHARRYPHCRCLTLE
jgi:enediyne polyketide synthase